MQERKSGQIVHLIEDKGFGFIASQGVEKNIFFHARDMRNAHFNELRKGNHVTFEIFENEKGLNAGDVELTK